jgi:hypothetical protein
MPSSDFDVVTGPPAPSRPVAPAAGPAKPPAGRNDLPAALAPLASARRDPGADAIADAGMGGHP